MSGVAMMRLLGATLAMCGVRLHAGILLAASSHEEFRRPSPPDGFYRGETSGSALLGGQVIPTAFPVGMLSETFDNYVIAGSALSSSLLRIDLDGNLLSTISTSLPAACCNVDFARTEQSLYRASYSRGIYELDPQTGATRSFRELEDVVGMTYAAGNLWISRWSVGQVGTWNPQSNVFTPVFTLSTRVGGLAYDADSGVLWVGRQFGIVEPYNLQGQVIGPSFRPFGAIDETIDGLAYIVPEPASVLLVVFGGLLIFRRR